MPFGIIVSGAQSSDAKHTMDVEGCHPGICAEDGRCAIALQTETNQEACRSISTVINSTQAQSVQRQDSVDSIM